MKPIRAQSRTVICAAGKTYLCTVMTDWVDMIEELGGGGVMDEDVL